MLVMPPSGLQRAGPAQLEAVQTSSTLFRLRHDLNTAARSGLRKVALTAVIENDAGELSYLVLAAPAGKPDFHHPDGFTLELSPP